MKKASIGWNNARYRKIPCWFNLETSEILGTNWFYDLLIEINIWIDVNIVCVDGFPIEVFRDKNDF